MSGYEHDDWIPETIAVPIEREFDLHHYPPSDILPVVDAYLEAAIERGFREVRLVHGKGKGVQRANVQVYLSKDSRVLNFVDAPPERGGWGATLVWLRVP